MLRQARSDIEARKLRNSKYTIYYSQNHVRLASLIEKFIISDWSFDEDLATKLLLQPLEQFVWGATDAKHVTLGRSTLCGHVFNRGEQLYRCKDCGRWC